MNKLKDFYNHMLKPYVPSPANNSFRKRYFECKFVKDNKTVTVTLEFDGGDYDDSRTNNTRLLRYWAGIYYGIVSNDKNALSEDEIRCVKESFLKEWSLRHQMSVVHNPDNLFLPPDDSSKTEHWFFWIRVREEEGIEEAQIGMGYIKDALSKLGFSEQ